MKIPPQRAAVCFEHLPATIAVLVAYLVVIQVSQSFLVRLGVPFLVFITALGVEYLLEKRRLSRSVE